MASDRELTYRLTALDVSTLLYNVYRGAQLEEVGYEDCERTLDQLRRDLSRDIRHIKRSVLESALWSCNLMDEAEQFWSPLNESFAQFYRRILKPYGGEFDEFYNWIKDMRDGKTA